MSEIDDLKKLIIKLDQAGRQDDAAKLAEQVRSLQANEPIEKGNIDLGNRPVVKNDDGSISTVKSMSFGEDGKEVLIPQISPSGTTLTPEGAIALYHQTGKHLGKFNSVDAANAYAQKLHEDQAKQYSKPDESLMESLTRMGGNAVNELGSVGSAVASGVRHPVDVALPGVLNAVEYPAKLASGLFDKLVSPSTDNSAESRRMQEEGKKTVEGTGAYLKQYIDDPKEKIISDPLGSFSDIATLLTGGGSMAAKIPMLSRAAEIAAQTGRTIAPTKLPSKAASAVLETGRANRSPGMREMAKTMGDLEAAQARARELGPEARGYNLTPGGAATAANLIRNPGKNISPRSGLLDVIQKQIDSARDRFDTGVTGVLGQPITQHQLDKSLEAAKSFEADTRQSAKYLAMDADTLTPFYSDALRRAENNADLRGPLDRIKKTLTMPKTKDPIDRASQVWNVHDAIGKEIANGSDRNNVLGQFQTSVRNLMTKDPDIQKALSQVEQAERLGSSRDLGRSILASGRSTVGPDAIASRAARLSPQERAALSGSVADQLMTLADEKGLNRALEEASRAANNKRIGAALGKDTADRLNQVVQRERSINRTAEKLQKASEQAPDSTAKQTMKTLVRAIPYTSLGGSLGAGLGYMLMSGNWTPAMYALAGAGGAAAVRGARHAISRPEATKANMIKMLKTEGGQTAEMVDKLADYTGKGKDYKRFIENLLMALAQSQNMQQQGQ